MAYLFSSIALLVAVISFFYLRFFIIKRTSAERLNEQLLEETRETIRQMVDDIDRVTDRDAQLVEHRVEDLKALLADADRRIGAFSRELETRARRDNAYTELGRKAKQPDKAAPPEAGTLFDSAALNEADDTAALAAIAAAPPQLQPKPDKPEPAETLSKTERIILLAASGLSPAQIAAKLSMTTTEVEMLLVLHTKHDE